MTQRMDYTRYVAGFLFRNQGREVALIRKNKPDWQKGKLNGIGGKIEAGESPLIAMHREFQEETGADVFDWRPVACLEFLGNGRVYFFAAEGDFSLKSTTDEIVGWYPVKLVLQMSLDPLPNLSWLLPLALENNLTGHIYGRT
jgi:8-oxo-dGTP diphosphatase